MRPKELIIEGFGSFRERQTFTFPTEPGLYFMRGDNQHEPRLGANGAGKSTVWKALSWVLWDKLASGLRAGDVSSWGRKKETYVIFCFYAEHEGHERMYFLKRTWKPNSWTLQHLFDSKPIDLTKDETNPVLAMLRLKFEPFLHSVYLAQREEMFLDMKPEPKAQLFASVMDLDRWLDYSSGASGKASDQDKISRRLESERAELKGRLEESDTKGLEESAEEFEQKRKRKMRDIEDAYHETLTKSKEAKKRLEGAQSAEDAAFKKHKLRVQDRNEVYDELEKGLKALREAENLLLGLERDLDHAQQHLKRVTEDGAVCPTCQRAFVGKLRTSLLAEVRDAEQNAVESVREIGGAVESWRASCDKAREALRIMDQKASDAKHACDLALDETRNARRSHEQEERRLDELEEASERAEQEINPFLGMLEDQQESRAKLQERYKRVNAELDQSYERHALYSFWVRGFKEVRLQLISEALEQLEIEANSELMNLGLVNWELRFDVDAETKKGTLSRGFSVSVLSPYNKDRVPLASWSGGESQRLRLGAQAGLANLIRARTGCDFPLEVWDEPTEGLSEEGITDLLVSLKERALRERRTIWIVDHRALGFGGFAGTATIVKDEKGSRIVQARV